MQRLNHCMISVNLPYQPFLGWLYATIPAVPGLCKSFLRVSSALTILAAYTINGAGSPMVDE